MSIASEFVRFHRQRWVGMIPFSDSDLSNKPSLRALLQEFGELHFHIDMQQAYLVIFSTARFAAQVFSKLALEIKILFLDYCWRFSYFPRSAAVFLFGLSNFEFVYREQ